jgi:hypothetical protein
VLAVLAFAWIIPFTPIGALLSFTALSLTPMLAIAGIVVVYLVLAESAKYLFYRTFPLAP